MLKIFTEWFDPVLWILKLIKYLFCGNEHISTRSYLCVIIVIPVAAFILITILNIKMLLI